MPGQVILKVDGKNGKIKESYVYGNGERILTKHYEYTEDGTRMVKEELGLAYFGARWYNADMGRFISCDPIAIKIEEPVNINKYQYCANNPLKYVDPTGKAAHLIASFMGSIMMGGSSGVKWDKQINQDKIIDRSKMSAETEKEMVDKLQELEGWINSEMAVGNSIDKDMLLEKIFEIFSEDVRFNIMTNLLEENGWQYVLQDYGDNWANNETKIIGLTINPSFLKEVIAGLIHEIYEVGYYEILGNSTEVVKGIDTGHFYAIKAVSEYSFLLGRNTVETSIINSVAWSNVYKESMIGIWYDYVINHSYMEIYEKIILHR